MAGGIVVPGTGRLIACLGVDDLVIVDMPDTLLVTTRARSQEVKRLVKKAKDAGWKQLLWNSFWEYDVNVGEANKTNAIWTWMYICINLENSDYTRMQTGRIESRLVTTNKYNIIFKETTLFHCQLMLFLTIWAGFAYIPTHTSHMTRTGSVPSQLVQQPVAHGASFRFFGPFHCFAVSSLF